MMRSYVVSALIIVSAAVAQTLPPSPTASFGCKPHGNHWDCDGPISVTLFSSVSGSNIAIATTTSAHDDDDDEHDHDHSSGTGSLPPSPTASVGCKPHGNHWDCEGPVATASTTRSLASASGTIAVSTTITASGVGASTSTPTPAQAAAGASQHMGRYGLVALGGMVAAGAFVL